MRSLAAGILVAAFALPAGSATAPPPPADLAAAESAFAEGLEARKSGDLKTYRARIERAAELLPDNSRLLYRLAGARLLDGDAAGALAALGAQVDAGIFRDPRSDADFAKLGGDPAFAELLTRMEKLKEPLVASTVAFEAPERDLLVEGIAYDPASKSFFLSSVRQSKVVRRGADGVWSRVDAYPAAAGSPLGLALDASRRRLWIAAAALPHGGAPPERLNRGGALAIDLASGKVAVAPSPPEEGKTANDVVVAGDGGVFYSDPGAKAIVRIAPDGARAPIVSGNGLRSPGGLALSADGKLLYVADWTNGLALIEVANGEIAWIRPPKGGTTLGIDGLLREGDSLIAIQNGVNPPRIARFTLAADGRSLTGVTTLERAVTAWDEPTLGVVVDGALHYVATSQWASYGEDGKPTGDPAALPIATVRKLALR
jgi:hypothetical protein